MSTTPRRQAGFTIVELLIVIVVIAILATITILAYKGIRERAMTAAYTVAADQLDKFLQAEAILAGSLPSTTGYICAGRAASDFPAGDGFAAGECFRVSDSGGSVSTNYSAGSAFFSALQTSRDVANGLLPVTQFTFSTGVTYRSRGLLFAVNATNRTYSIQWVPQMAGECGRGVSAGGAVPGSLSGDMCAMLRNY